jgi:hypothetical protein
MALVAEKFEESRLTGTGQVLLQAEVVNTATAE